MQRTRIPARHNERARIAFELQDARFAADNPYPAPIEAPLPDECEPVAKHSRGAISRANKALAMLTGDVSGLGLRAFDNCFENGDGKAVAAVITERLKSDADLARRVYYGKRSYRPAYKGDYPVTNYARHFLSPQWLAIIILHGIITLNNVNDTYGMRAKVAELLPQDAPETRQDETATQVADNPEIAPQEQKNGLGDDLEAQLDPVAALIARMDALEAIILDQVRPEVGQVDHPSVEITNVVPLPIDPRALAVAKARQEIADDTPIGGKQRSPAHVRAIMAYLQLRSARKLGSSQRHIWSTHIDDLEQKLASMTEEAEYQRRKKETYQDRLKHQGERIASHAAQQTLWESIASEWGYAARTDAKRRRAVLKARDLQNRLYAEYKIVDRANDKRMEAERELASLKQKLADPTNPARESDLLMLRDNAEKWQGKAEAAIAEGERLKQQVVHYGGQIENLAVRLARAEAMLRADPLQLTRIAA
jgi:hypothetical protein